VSLKVVFSYLQENKMKKTSSNAKAVTIELSQELERILPQIYFPEPDP